MSFGIYLKEYRKKRNLSIIDLAKLIGVTEPTIADFEIDKRLPSPGILEKIVKELCPDASVPNLVWGYLRQMCQIKSNHDYKQQITCERKGILYGSHAVDQ